MTYNSDLETRILDLDAIYLDPNNPRFIDDRHEEVKDDRAVESGVQQTTLEKMRNLYDVDSLASTIEKMGFLKVNRIVVRELKPHPGCYVVVEGNRRISACKYLKSQYDKGKNLDNKVLESILNIEALIYLGDDHSISWDIQGVNHLTGIRAWSPYNQAYHLVCKMERDCLTPGNVAKMFGLKGADAIKMVRAYYGLQQLKEDDEFGDRALNSHYSYFEEAFKKPDVTKWLEWNDNLHRFTNTTNVKKFYSWFLPYGEEPKKLPMAIDVRKLPPILQDQRALAAFESDETLEGALRIVGGNNGNGNTFTVTFTSVLLDLKQTSERIKRIPLGIFAAHREDIEEALFRIIDACNQILEMNNKK
jgi:hypothetical protein